MGALALKHLRHATGLSQEAFAKLLDFSAETIASIEQGRLEMSGNIARAAFVQTGALPVWLQLQDSIYPVAYAWTRENYAPSHFEAWKEMIRGDLLTSIAGGTLTSRFNAVLECLFQAAKEKNSLGKFQAALALEAFSLAFDQDFSDRARSLAFSNGIEKDFNFLACVGGRIEPRSK